VQLLNSATTAASVIQSGNSVHLFFTIVVILLLAQKQQLYSLFDFNIKRAFGQSSAFCFPALILVLGGPQRFIKRFPDDGTVYFIETWAKIG
jgi:hypothetical protein